MPHDMRDAGYGARVNAAAFVERLQTERITEVPLRGNEKQVVRRQLRTGGEGVRG